VGGIINCLIEFFWVGWSVYSDCETAEIKLNCPVVYVTIYVSLRTSLYSLVLFFDGGVFIQLDVLVLYFTMTFTTYTVKGTQFDLTGKQLPQSNERVPRFPEGIEGDEECSKPEPDKLHSNPSSENFRQLRITWGGIHCLLKMYREPYIGIGHRTTIQRTIPPPTTMAIRDARFKFFRSSRISSFSARRTCSSVASSPSSTPLRRMSQLNTVG
jgi:hypothetical protein